MGKLNIAHHKSYHPYRRDNIEKVRRDEEEAKLKESVEDGRMMLADSEARIDLLRHRAGLGTAKKSKGEDDGEIPAQPEAGSSSLTTPGGHINLFEDLERAAIPVTSRRAEKAKAVEEDKGVPLAPSEKDRKPWYSESAQNEVDQDRQRRDLARKSAHDPLTSINTQLGARSDNDQGTRQRDYRDRPREVSSRPPEVSERLNRESSERQRAMALIARRKREQAGSDTPSTVHGGMRGGYGDVFNRREVEEAHRHRDRRWDRNDHGVRSKW